MSGAELTERHQRVGDASALHCRGEVIERRQRVERHERRQLAVQCPDDVNRVRAALLLRLDAHWELGRLLGDVVDLAREILEDQIAHLLRLLDRAQLSR